MAAGAERQPVQIDAGFGLRERGAYDVLPSDSASPCGVCVAGSSRICPGLGIDPPPAGGTCGAGLSSGLFMETVSLTPATSARACS